jgi:hypothetical protein
MNYEHITTNTSGDDRDRTGNLRLAKPALSQLSYVPGPCSSLVFREAYLVKRISKEPTEKQATKEWARVDSDYRPHAYQACALTN